MIRHPCAAKTGNAPECSGCPVKAAGFCTAFRDVLGKIMTNLASKYATIAREDVEEILTNTVAGVLAGIEGYEGRRGAKFSTWVWGIYRNKTADFFRSGNAHAALFAEIGAKPNHRDAQPELKAAIRECFKKNLNGDSTGCVRLYLDLYRYYRSGKSRKDLAVAYGMKPNTLNQKVVRCRKTMRRLFEKYV